MRSRGKARGGKGVRQKGEEQRELPPQGGWGMAWGDSTLPHRCPGALCRQQPPALQPHQDDFGLVQLRLHSGHGVSIPGVLGTNSSVMVMVLAPPQGHQGRTGSQQVPELPRHLPCHFQGWGHTGTLCTWYLLRYPSKAE